ncbi:nicotinamidase/pyrazinamidase [Tangfeifania diversioriginum]|uniref:Nicotinamidase n=1 Tax=Tangfeifania diversioriginum TaxID=1168035 RepID=A0A1M6CJU4_9BACT|nr:bifunctional nicotinamidase/pyrazinamidase [Tangfeifania diversioriginum]SHI61249.1 nicotinamidase/pyrazinamidase [Tangfeifania diversioriginum]
MKALILIDIQNDFIPGGSLEVPSGDEIIPVVNNLQEKFDLVVATQDWHPQNHMSFASNHKGKEPFEMIELGGMDQILWPDHCVQDSKGAEFHPELNTTKIETIFRKGMDSEIDSYSGFYDNGHKKSTGLAGYLREKGATELYFCGLAADVCVYYSIKDAQKEGFSATLIEDATRALDNKKFAEMKAELQGLGLKEISAKYL